MVLVTKSTVKPLNPKSRYFQWLEANVALPAIFNHSVFRNTALMVWLEGVAPMKSATAARYLKANRPRGVVGGDREDEASVPSQ